MASQLIPQWCDRCTTDSKEGMARLPVGGQFLQELVVGHERLQPSLLLAELLVRDARGSAEKGGKLWCAYLDEAGRRAGEHVRDGGEQQGADAPFAGLAAGYGGAVDSVPVRQLLLGEAGSLSLLE